jgi:hypothetical protein
MKTIITILIVVLSFWVIKKIFFKQRDNITGNRLSKLVPLLILLVLAFILFIIISISDFLN